MIKARHQKGATMWSMLSIILMIGFMVYLGSIIGNIYIDHKFIRGSMQEVVNRSDFKTLTKKQILESINKRLSIDNIRGLDKDVISLKAEQNGTRYIKIQYSKKSDLFENIYILIEFDEEIRPNK